MLESTTSQRRRALAALQADRSRRRSSNLMSCGTPDQFLPPSGPVSTPEAKHKSDMDIELNYTSYHQPHSVPRALDAPPSGVAALPAPVGGRMTKGSGAIKAFPARCKGGFSTDVNLLADVMTPSFPGKSGPPRLDGPQQQSDSLRTLLGLQLKRVASTARG